MEPRKRQKTQHKETSGYNLRSRSNSKAGEESVKEEVRVKFQNTEGVEVDYEISLDTLANKAMLNKVLNGVIQSEDGVQPYQFYIGDHEIRSTIKDLIDDYKLQHDREKVLTITYKPEALFRIKPVTRASSTLAGHSEAVLSACFSPDGQELATGSGDTTVRLWDLNTETPLFTCKGHKHWVLYVAFSPDCTKVASGGMDKLIFVWNAETGEQVGRPLKGH